MIYQAKNYDYLYGTQGFSDELLKNHFTLYEGYVKNVNTLAAQIAKWDREGKEKSPEYGECKRRFGWEFNGMRLHEYYFGNMKKNSGEKLEHLEHSQLREKIEKQFGGLEAWQKDFKATGTIRGIGWVMLVFDPFAEHLFNVWINEHDTGHGAGLAPLLVMDVFEHAFIQDYGLKKDAYIEAFFDVIDWHEVSGRFQEVFSVVHHAH